jgi:hypothetical protein
MEKTRVSNFERGFMVVILQGVLISSALFCSEPAAVQNDDRGVLIESDSSASKEEGRSVIVVIGIDDYTHWKKLRNGVSDAKGVQAVLVEKFGFSAPIPPLLNEQLYPLSR